MKTTRYESTEILVINRNSEPLKPSTPEGTSEGKPNKEYIFSSYAEDPDNDNIFYKWDWGDGNMSDWIGPFKSGEACNQSNIWQNQGIYQIRVKAKDATNAESQWSDFLEVSLPKSHFFFEIIIKTITKYPFFKNLFDLNENPSEEGGY